MATNSYPFLFLLVPIVIFGPVLGLVLWMFGIKTLFTRALDSAERSQQKQGSRYGNTLLPRQRLKPVAWVSQGVAYSAFAVALGFLSTSPSYHYTDGTHSQIKLSVNHPGQRKVACRQRSAEELVRLPPNMRILQACERARWPVRVELALDRRSLFAHTAPPAGLSGDGASSFYETFLVPAASYTLSARLIDGVDISQAITLTQTIALTPRQVLAIGFNAEERRFFIQ